MTKKTKPSHAGAPHELVEAARDVIAEADVLLSSKTSSRPSPDRLRAAVERLRKLMPEAAPPAPKRAKTGAPRTQEEWDARVLEWALNLETPITIDRAFAALAPDSPIGSTEHGAIAASLNRLPRDRFTFSWYMANTALAPMWIKQAK